MWNAGEECRVIVLVVPAHCVHRQKYYLRAGNLGPIVSASELDMGVGKDFILAGDLGEVSATMSIFVAVVFKMTQQCPFELDMDILPYKQRESLSEGRGPHRHFFWPPNMCITHSQPSDFSCEPRTYVGLRAALLFHFLPPHVVSSCAGFASIHDRAKARQRVCFYCISACLYVRRPTSIL